MKDPAEEDGELKKKLDESNKKLHSDLNAVSLFRELVYSGSSIKKFLEIEK